MSPTTTKSPKGGFSIDNLIGSSETKKRPFKEEKPEEESEAKRPKTEDSEEDDVSAAAAAAAAAIFLSGKLKPNEEETV